MCRWLLGVFPPAALSTLKRKSLDTCPNPSKSNPSQYSLCFIFPNTKSQELFVSRGEIERFLIWNSQCKLIVLSWSGLKVLVPSAVDTRSSLRTTFMALESHLCRDADVVIFNPALINRALKASPGTCHRLVLSEGSTDQMDTLRSLFPEFQIDSFLRSKKYHMLSCSSNETTGDGLVRFEIDPHNYECFTKNIWMLHLAAVSIGYTETIESGDLFQNAFDCSNSYLVTGAFEVLRRLKESSGNVSKAIHLASDILVPENLLTPHDQQTDRILPFPRNIETLERNQKLVLDFFHQCIQPRLGMAKIKEFAELLFDGDEKKYDECLQQLKPTDKYKSDELLHQIYIKYCSVAGKAIDFSKLKCVFDQMGHKELSDLCGDFHIEHSFAFKIHFMG